MMHLKMSIHTFKGKVIFGNLHRTKEDEKVFGSCSLYLADILLFYSIFLNIKIQCNEEQWNQIQYNEIQSKAMKYNVIQYKNDKKNKKFNKTK